MGTFEYRTSLTDPTSTSVFLCFQYLKSWLFIDISLFLNHVESRKFCFRIANDYNDDGDAERIIIYIIIIVVICITVVIIIPRIARDFNPSIFQINM